MDKIRWYDIAFLKKAFDESQVNKILKNNSKVSTDTLLSASISIIHCICIIYTTKSAETDGIIVISGAQYSKLTSFCNIFTIFKTFLFTQALSMVSRKIIAAEKNKSSIIDLEVVYVLWWF